jgi:ABC-type Zn2+ transport system substrate-binding protein/surface adhesin
LEKAWLGFRAAKRLENYTDMKLYASIIQRLEKELKIEVNDFPELGLCACNPEEANTEEEEEEEEEEDEEDDSKLAIIDPWTNEKIQEAKEDEDDYREVDFDSL